VGLVAGLMSSSITRLQKTWNLVPPQIVSKFESECSIMLVKNFKVLRDAVKQSEPPCLPYLGIYLGDCTFIEDGNPTKFANGMINFKKCRLVAGVILEIQQYQQKPYNLSNAQSIQDFLSQSIEEVQSLDDKALYELSLVAEPRVTAVK